MARKIIGSVAAIDASGNVVTDIVATQLADAPRDDRLRIECDEHETFGLYSTSVDQPPMTLVAVLNAAGQVEIVLVGDSAADMLGIRAGARVVVSW